MKADMSELQKQLLEAIKTGCLHGTLKVNEPLRHYTTWRIGGLAECLYQPQSVTDLQQILRLLAKGTAIHWIGLGSNLLVRDGGVKGLVIATNGVLDKLDFVYPAQQSYGLVSAQAGVACAILSRKAAHSSLHGVEFLSGIPGTIGGALNMNAGAFGGSTWDFVVGVTMITAQGELLNRTPDEFVIRYRDVYLKKKQLSEWFLSVQFKLPKDEQGVKQSKSEIKRLLAKRAATQPTKQANAGSVFKNPDNDYAARLIESSGLKGKAINGAQISEKHANFIVNNGGAKAKDIEALMLEIKEQVLAQHQIELIAEVQIIGEY